MRQIKALAGQSVFDIALLYCGDATKAWDIARDNGIDISSTFKNSTEIAVCDEMNNVARTYEMNGSSFACGITNIAWALMGGMWQDEGSWSDGELWID